ncbi:MAG: type 1 glutamine amidotransferase [Candidatus Dormibacter sp.]|uniref:type 1 glutamine amidotransferase n=1 Tax=Candidatus Dormibacter sp. TaxID=2973982 RepID=UPI002692F635
MSASGQRLTIGWLYSDLMNIYGDRGNIQTLVQRARWRGVEVRVLELGKGASEGIEAVDVFFFGGGQDKEQELVYDDLLETKAIRLANAMQRGAAFLAVCGGYQLLGHYYQTAQGERLPGIGLLDVRTVAGGQRCIGDVVIESDPGLGLQPRTLVGFENHSGRTYLGEGVRPLGRVRRGNGNNGEDGSEGAVSGNIFGTYLHGSLLPKNPHLTDLILSRALNRELDPLDDSLELAAHNWIKDRELSGSRRA